MISKPTTCRGCSLEKLGQGFSYPSGPVNAKILFIAEALGNEEVRKGEPLVGSAGQLFNRLINRVGLRREDVRCDNSVRCQPPMNRLERTSYGDSAIRHCHPNVQATIEENHKVIVAMGATALRRVLDLPKKRGITVENFHGSPIYNADGRLVVCTYHPSHILRGANNLTSVFLYDVKKAIQAANGYEREKVSLVLDPPYEWFQEWVDNLLANPEVWVSIDIETPDKANKAEDELTSKDRSTTILRVNFSCSTEEGITVPYQGPYVTEIDRILRGNNPKIFWNHTYDTKRLEFNGHTINPPIFDMMDGWHALQSDLPKGLGFVSSFYSNLGPWKHLSEEDPAYYGAMDGIQTQRCAYGIAKDLKDEGLWDVFYRYAVLLDSLCLRPAERVGILIDRPRLEALRDKVSERLLEVLGAIQGIVPTGALPLEGPPGGYKRKPDDCPEDQLVEHREVMEVRVCKSCDVEGVAWNHNCTRLNGLGLKPILVKQSLERSIWYKRGEFNPNSPKQILDYAKFRGHKLEATEKDELEAIYRKTKDPVYGSILEHRQAAKIFSTYIEGSLSRADSNNRLHATFLHKPSTWRLSCVSPNLQNIAAGRDGRPLAAQLAMEYRQCIVASEGCSLIEADFSGIEAVLVGWFANDPDYIRMAKLGVHAFLTAEVVGKPANRDWPTEKLSAYLKEIKGKYKVQYDACKRCIHGSSYGLTPYGMRANYPDIFKTVADATTLQNKYWKLAPRVQRWQQTVMERAHKQGYLGGPGDHPFNLKHWFWNVFIGRKTPGGYKLQLGHDAKRAVAFYPQSTAATIIFETMLRLFTNGEPNYIGDIYWGRTPLRAQIHDSILLEVPEDRVSEGLGKLVYEMKRPIRQMPLPKEWDLGDYLTIGVEAKVGKNWAPMEEDNPDGMKVMEADEGLATEVVREEEEDEDE